MVQPVTLSTLLLNAKFTELSKLVTAANLVISVSLIKDLPVTLSTFKSTSVPWRMHLNQHFNFPCIR
jgi:hypothetical protein